MADKVLDQDPRDVPRYSTSEAARYVRVPAATVRSWVVGRPYHTLSGRRESEPLVYPATPSLLSFRNLVELHVLRSIRKVHGVSMPSVRAAVGYMRDHFHTPCPFATHDFTTNGVDLFIEQMGRTHNISRGGMKVLAESFAEHLARVERDEHHVVARLFPFLDGPENRAILIDPKIRFGRPVLARSRIPVAPIAERYNAGETEEDLALDFGCEVDEISAAIRAAA